MKAAVLRVCSEARFVDISHEIPPFDVAVAGFVLWAGSQGFPPGTVHLAVVDPGVGGDRRALALDTGSGLFVGPDNGLFSMLVRKRRGVKAVELARPTPVSATFEGRDLFAPAAARLACGASLAELGRPVEDLVVLPDPGRSVIWVDNFGNLVTNLLPPVGRLRVGERLVTRSARTYSEGQAEEPFWYVGSLGLVEIGIRQGRADSVLRAAVGTRIRIVPDP
jgi:S-adenosyl-L-methionine hydrolase (adenosine-forming)